MSNDEGMSKSESAVGHLCFDINSSFVIRASSFSRHLFGKRWSQLCHQNKRRSDCDQKEGEKLATRKTGDQARVRLAKIFDHNSEERVAHKKKSGQNSVWLSHTR